MTQVVNRNHYPNYKVLKKVNECLTMKSKRVPQQFILTFVLMLICTLPGCGSSSSGPKGNATTGSDDSLVWDQGNWDQKTWQ